MSMHGHGRPIPTNPGTQQEPVWCGRHMPSIYAHKLKDTWSGASQFPANAVPLSGICMHIHIQ